jgi:hypothetical protein
MTGGGAGAIGGIEVVEGSSSCSRGIDGGGIGMCTGFGEIGVGSVPFPFPSGAGTGSLRVVF